MTSRQISIAQHDLIADRTAARARELGYFAKVAPSSDPRIAAMDRIADRGEYDRADDGLVRLRRGNVGGEMMTARVQALEGQLLITFYCAMRRHTRRILVDEQGAYHMDADGRAIVVGEGNKYRAAMDQIWSNRAN